VIARFALWLLRMFCQIPQAPDVYALVVPGERLADVTTNKLRALALRKEMRARGESCALVVMRAVEVVRT
jgi:hypothetical protein